MKKTVLITGCSYGGMGSHLAEAFHARGFHVFATLRNTAKAGALADKEGIDILDLEVTSAESVQSCAKAVGKITGGSLDVLVNNAGADFTLLLLDTSINDARRLYDLNLWAPLAVTQAFAPMIVQAKGVICNVSSVSSICNFAWAGIYASSKSALNVLSETLRVELQPFGVRVLTVMLGGCATNAHAGMPDLVLPPGSRYQPIWETIDRQKKGLVYKNKQDPAVAARNIVSDVIGGRQSYVWRGASSTLCWFCSTFMPNDVFVKMVNERKGLDMLAGKKH
ncbi:NAD(P)-binding protein [Parathielavia appendiculata]|uniref:NAD(P)-binding protein n=1 Tax=Parathielavia appendiculata TaxID=2587402 RepID=A0AAN6U3H1_9PEZI|nr:NAD(P)-binding protein [Parathielavia appendiculata]